MANSDRDQDSSELKAIAPPETTPAVDLLAQPDAGSTSSGGAGEALSSDAAVRAPRTGGIDRFRRFVRRHEIAFAVGSSMVVLLSFVTKEEIGGNLRDEIERIEQARNRYEVRTGLDAVDSRGPAIHSFDRDESPAEQRFYENLAVVQYSGSILDRAGAADELDDVSGTHVGSSDVNRRNFERDRRKITAESAVSHTVSWADWFSLELEYRAYEHDLKERVEARLRHLRSQARLSNYLIIYIFLVGWFLGLASKLVGKEEEQEA